MQIVGDFEDWEIAGVWTIVANRRLWEFERFWEFGIMCPNLEDCGNLEYYGILESIGVWFIVQLREFKICGRLENGRTSESGSLWEFETQRMCLWSVDCGALKIVGV